MRLFVLPAALCATPALADTREYGHMMDYGYGSGIGMMFGPVLWLIVLGAVVAGIIWFARRTDGQAPGGSKSNARDELDLRFARGEIDAEDYASRKKLLAD